MLKLPLRQRPAGVTGSGTSLRPASQNRDAVFYLASGSSNHYSSRSLNTSSGTRAPRILLLLSPLLFESSKDREESKGTELSSALLWTTSTEGRDCEGWSTNNRGKK